MKFKKIICWPPLLGGIGAGITIGILAYITFQSVLAGTNYGLWLAASFGSSVVVVFDIQKMNSLNQKTCYWVTFYVLWLELYL